MCLRQPATSSTATSHFSCRLPGQGSPATGTRQIMPRDNPSLRMPLCDKGERGSPRMETRGQMDQKPLITEMERKMSWVELSFEQLLSLRPYHPERARSRLNSSWRRGRKWTLHSARQLRDCEQQKRAGAGWGSQASPQQQLARQPLSARFPTPYPPLNFTPIKSFVQGHSAY